MTQIMIIIASVLFVATATLVRPEFLAQNPFLDSFVNSELLALQAVVLTITFASVANTHLALNEIIARVYGKDIKEGQAKAKPARDEINSNAWLLFWTFAGTAGVLLIKGMFDGNIFVQSAMNGLSAVSFLINVLVFYDIYSTVFHTASSDMAVMCNNPPEYSPDTPKPPVSEPKHRTLASAFFMLRRSRRNSGTHK